LNRRSRAVSGGRHQFGHHTRGFFLDDGAALGQLLFAMPHVFPNDRFKSSMS